MAVIKLDAWHIYLVSSFSCICSHLVISSDQSNAFHFALLVDIISYFVFMTVTVYIKAEHKLLWLWIPFCIFHAQCMLVNYYYGLDRPKAMKDQSLCIYLDWFCKTVKKKKEMSTMYNLLMFIAKLVAQLRTFKSTLKLQR